MLPAIPRSGKIDNDLNPQCLPERFQLLQDRTATGAAGGVLELHRALVVEDAEHVVAEPLVDALELLDAELVHPFVLVLGQCNHLARQVVRLAERYT